LWAGRLDKIMAIRKRYSPEQIVRKLVGADRLLAEGKDTAAVCRELGVSEATYHRWRNQFGGLKAEDAKRLKDLELENTTLKRLLADAELEKAALKEIARETSRPGTPAGSRSSSSAGAGGQRTLRLPGDRATPRD
jgi:putative transposase